MKLRLLGLVVLLSSLVVPAHAAPKGKLSLSVTRASSADFVLGSGQRVVTDENPFEGPSDVRIVTKAHWYTVVLRDASGDPEFLLLKSPRFSEPFVFLPFDPIGAGRHTLTVAGDAPVSVTLDIAGGAKRTTLRGRPSFATYRDADLSGPVPVAANGRVTVDLPSKALVLAASGASNQLGQVGRQEVCLARSGLDCTGSSFVSVSPGAGGGYQTTAVLQSLEAGRWDAVSRQLEAGFLQDPFVLALALG